jgi:small subunit ribosomal protein S1
LADIREGEIIKVYVYHLPEGGGNPLASVTKALRDDAESPNRDKDQDGWTSFEKMYDVGDLVEGTVKNIKKYGAFVELPAGVDGLIHVSEMSTGYTNSPWDVVSPGEHVTVQIIRIEPERKRIGLRLMGISEDLEE